MKIRKVLCLLITLVMFATLMVACGGADEAAAPDTPANGGAAGGEVAEGETFDVVFWHHESPVHRVDAFQRVIDLFMEENPNVNLTQEIVSWGDSLPRTLAAAESGTLPDFMFGIPELTMINLFNAGVLTPVTEVVREVDERYTIFPDILGMHYFDGEYWGLPAFTMPFAFAYRPSILAEFGFDGPPETWDELIEMARYITENGEGNVFGIGLGGGRNLFVDQQIYMFMASRGAKFFNEDGSIAFNSPEMIEVFQFYYELYQYSPVGSEAWMWGEIEMNLAAGMIAMAPYLPSIQIRMNEMDSDDLGFAHLPLFQPGFPQGNLTYPNTVVTFSQTVERGNLPVVEEFMRFIMRPEINVHLTSGMEPGGFIPSTEAAAAYEGYWNNPIIQRFLAVNEIAIETLEFATLYGFEFGRWVNLGIGEIGGANVLSDAMSRVLSGELTPEEAAQWGAEQMEAMSVPIN